MPKFNFLSLRRSFWIFIIILIAIIGILSALWGAYVTDQKIRTSLIGRVETVAAALHSEDIKNLSGTKDDLVNQYYTDLKYQLTKVRSISSDIRFVYIVGLQDEEVFFYADSEPADSLDYSPPGQRYQEASTELLQIFQDGKSFIEGPIEDRWGNWLSAFAPIRDVRSTNYSGIVGVIGMDISNNLRHKQILNVVFMIMGTTCLVELLFLLFYFYLRRRQKTEEEKEVKKIKEQQYEFVSMVSHQLRTPISAAIAVFEILKDKKGFEEVNDAYIKISHLNNIVNTLLFFIENKDILGRKKLITDRKSDLVVVIKNQLQFLKKDVSNKKIVVNTVLPNEQIVPMDEILLSRVIHSVIENAIIYNKEYGTVDITLKGTNEHPVLVVTDSGYGIPAKETDKIFNAFFRATNASLGLNEGSGLSLYITKEIMRLAGGSITCKSVEGKGSTFYLNF